jgi:hypothetical protein
MLVSTVGLLMFATGLQAAGMSTMIMSNYYGEDSFARQDRGAHHNSEHLNAAAQPGNLITNNK